MERVYFGAGFLLSSGVCLRHASGFRPAQRGLGFWRVGPRIFEAAQASEIGGVDGHRRSIEVLRLGLRLGNTGLRSPGLIRRAWSADGRLGSSGCGRQPGSASLLIHMAWERTISARDSLVTRRPPSNLRHVTRRRKRDVFVITRFEDVWRVRSGCNPSRCQLVSMNGWRAPV